MAEVLLEAAMKEREIRNWSKFLVHAVHLMEADRLELPCHLSAFSLTLLGVMSAAVCPSAGGFMMICVTRHGLAADK